MSRCEHISMQILVSSHVSLFKHQTALLCTQFFFLEQHLKARIRLLNAQFACFLSYLLLNFACCARTFPQRLFAYPNVYICSSVILQYFYFIYVHTYKAKEIWKICIVVFGTMCLMVWMCSSANRVAVSTISRSHNSSYILMSVRCKFAT